VEENQIRPSEKKMNPTMSAAAPQFELRQWREDFREGFAEMHADSAVMFDLGGPFDRGASDAKFDRYREAWESDRISRWAIADVAGTFLGYVGVMKHGDPRHPLGTHYEIGWRLRRVAWGKGYVTESARCAQAHAWGAIDATEIVSYTAVDNQRSRNVMARLNLRRDASRDFTACYPRGDWTGLVWVAKRSASALRTANS
jgi:RimJ/RimL family protein N-acetyltransferase